ncbi:hypothetical protein BKA67DRAFT_683986 [Truncatella angustata]|uniref:Uncharacterized protein n=1 Tax=Truncatella angustata TaxID=152316 RepID=A0A9P8RIY2_9PEZI|nr:uncharacterized protein BKA67DRAFT_683986 [Truncatella angustata]KAH6646737.1 hypothetical protein BKA67DRAFT_683986 [Truncatella angustata]
MSIAPISGQSWPIDYFQNGERNSRPAMLSYTRISAKRSHTGKYLATVGHGSILTKVDRKRRVYRERLQQALNLRDLDHNDTLDDMHGHDLSLRLFGTRPNSWCGVSNEVIDIFGQVLALCHSVRSHDRDISTLTLSVTSSVLCDISVARELQSELLAMDFGVIVLTEELEGYLVHTQDEKTPLLHLLQTAEAYRQAALLQLHLAFVDFRYNASEWA